MKLSVTESQPTRAKGMLALPLVEGVKTMPKRFNRLDKDLGWAFRRAREQDARQGKAGELSVVRLSGRFSGKGGLFGLGKDVSPQVVRKYAADAVQVAASERCESVWLHLPDFGSESVERMTAAAVEGLLLGSYRFGRYRQSEPGEVRVKEATVVLPEGMDTAAAKRAVRSAKIHAEATAFARDLVNEPASEMTPERLMEEAVAIGERSDRIEVKVMDRGELEQMKAGGLLAVAQGSDHPPYMVHLKYVPEGGAKTKVALVGKGLTFDSGGLSLKPSNAMEDMKIDMSGAAAVLGAMSAVAKLKPEVEVHAVVGLCENMPSGRAMRPGDVVRTMSGKTVEVLNTDAEGRVTLADTLHYAAKLKPDFIVDLATLTGACMIALGQEVAGLMSNSDGLSERLLEAAGSEGELLWRLPLPAEYEPLLKSRIADLRNISTSKYGGAITAGLFLKEFVGGCDWAHLDIAGPAWAEKSTVPHQPPGATGFGVRTVLRFLASLK